MYATEESLSGQLLIQDLISGVLCLVWQAIERIQTEVSTEREGRQSQVEFMPLDLASLQSAREFTVAFQDKNLPLHILINNAGVAWVPLSQCS